MSAAATMALAALVAGGVLAATAGPRVALAARTQALHQTLAATTPLARTIIAATEWSTITSDLDNDSFGSLGSANLTAGQLSEVTSQLHGDFDRGVVKLAPADADWMSMTTLLHTVTSTSGLPGAGTFEVQFEVSYRQPFTQYMRLVAGRYPGTASASVSPVLQVAVSSQTARQFGLHPGSKVPITPPKIAYSGSLAKGITLEVTGIIAPRDASATFWTDDPVVLTPDLSCVDCVPSIWIAGAFIGPGELGALQSDFGPEDMALQWVFPVDVGSAGGQQAQPLYNALNEDSTQSPPLTGGIAAASSALTVSSALLQPVGTFLDTAAQVDTLLWLLYVSLAVAGAVALVLAARIVAIRRSAELAVRRARGASLPQIAMAAAGGAAIACVPATLLGAVLGVLITPGAEPAGGWWAPAAVL
ncbi:FtsX-like permease family protein, partial [Trebonia sp.]|uniref:FtsX-like permease family protein n=1 Tax=Trebonia sp. TaxID=2767075 RepID=UPI00262203F3